MNKNHSRPMFHKSYGHLTNVFEFASGCSKSAPTKPACAIRDKSTIYSKTPPNSQFLASNQPLDESIRAQAALYLGAFNYLRNINLTGGVIVSTDSAVTTGKNSLTTGNQLTITDVQNTASYSGSGYNLTASISTGKDKTGKDVTTPGGSMGIGSDSGSANSTSSSGISGIAGNTAVRTGDASTGIKPIFDADKVNRRIDAEIKITAAFGQQASKAIGDYAATQMDRATDLRIVAGKLPEGDAEQARLTAEANTIEAKWGDNGYLLGAAHIAVGGLTGGVNGALGAATSTLSAPLIAGALTDAGITGPLATIITAFGSTAVAGIAGGTAGAAGGFNEVVNNYLSHPQATARARLEDKQRRGKLTADEQQQLDSLNILDIAKDLQFKDACKTAGDACDAARRDLNASIGTYSGITAMVNPRLTPTGNASVNAERDQNVQLANAPGLASQTFTDSVLEFAVPQIMGYAVGGALSAYFQEARAIYSAIKADAALVGPTVLSATGGTAAVTKISLAPPPNSYPVYTRGAGAAEGPLPPGYTTVSRWVSPEEASLWVQNQGTAIPNAVPRNGTPQLYVSEAGAPRAPGANGTVRIDFAVPNSMLQSGNASNNFIILQPSSSTPIYNVNIYVPNGVTLPKAR